MFISDSERKMAMKLADELAKENARRSGLPLEMVKSYDSLALETALGIDPFKIYVEEPIYINI